MFTGIVTDIGTVTELTDLVLPGLDPIDVEDLADAFTRLEDAE